MLVVYTGMRPGSQLEPERAARASAARRLGALLLLALGMLPVPAAPAAAPAILVLGDSLSAGHGIDPARGWVPLLQERIRERGGEWRVVNASISGDTTRGGLARLPAALDRHRPDIVILELGGNDGLRGLPLAETRDNLAQMIRLARGRGIRVLLAGMRLPPNYGPRYTERFHAIYGDLAARFDLPLVPFLLEGIATHPELMQEDGIHPRAAAQPRIVDNVWPHLEPML